MMTRLGWAAFAALCVACMLGASPAGASTPLSKLQHQVRSLSLTLSRVKRAEAADHTTLSRLEQCLGVLPVAQYGDGASGTYGYVYDTTGAGTDLFTTALDVAPDLTQGLGFIVLMPACTSGASARISPAWRPQLVHHLPSLTP